MKKVLEVKIGEPIGASMDRFAKSIGAAKAGKSARPYFGVGFRTMMLGYYMKVDVAWPVENYKVQTPRAFVTLGFDF